MEQIIANIGRAIGSLVWSDWLIIVALAIFLWFGIKRGLIIEAINLLFLTVAIFAAYLLHDNLSHLAIIQSIFDSHQLQLGVSFGIIFVAVLILRRMFYRSTASASTTTNPCTLNKFFILLILVVFNLSISGYHATTVANFGLITYFIEDSALQIEISFILLFILITTITLLLKRIFGFSFRVKETCLFESLFNAILDGLDAVDTRIHTKTIAMRKTGGATIGLSKGFVLILMVILVLQSIDFIAQRNFWLESQNLLKTFQNIATSIRAGLTEHLLFINKD